MDLNDFSESKYLKKNDVPEHPGVVLQIDRFEVAEMQDGAKKPIVYFTDEAYKPCVLNATKRAILKSIANSTMTEDMVGKFVGVFHDPNVTYGTEVVGGLAFRMLTRAEAEKHYGSQNVATKGKPEGDDVPF